MANAGPRGVNAEMTTAIEIPKITYTTMSLDQMAAFNAAFDEALDMVRREKLGADHPVLIGGRESRSDSAVPDVAPHDKRITLGTFTQANADQVSEAIAAARAAFGVWGSMAYPERVRILRRAAQNFRENRFEIGAILSIEAGKNRLESIGEVDEAADLIDTYCDQI